MLRKQVKDITSSAPSKDQLTQLQKSLAQKDSELEKYQFQLESLKKEDSAFAMLKIELDEKTKEKSELAEKLAVKEAELEAKVRDIGISTIYVDCFLMLIFFLQEYDVKKTREEKDRLMRHYDSMLSKTSKELEMEKRESFKIREAMSSMTPTKKSVSLNSLKNHEEDNKNLREQLAKQTELIKKLEEMIPAKKT